MDIVLCVRRGHQLERGWELRRGPRRAHHPPAPLTLMSASAMPSAGSASHSRASGLPSSMHFWPSSVTRSAECSMGCQRVQGGWGHAAAKGLGQQKGPVPQVWACLGTGWGRNIVAWARCRLEATPRQTGAHLHGDVVRQAQAVDHGVQFIVRFAQGLSQLPRVCNHARVVHGGQDGCLYVCRCHDAAFKNVRAVGRHCARTPDAN